MSAPERRGAKYSPGLPYARSLLSKVRALVAQAHATNIPAHLCVVNDPTSGYADAEIEEAALAIAIQLQHHVAPEYELLPPTVEFLPHGKAPPASSLKRLVATICVVGQIHDTPENQGWHKPLATGGFDGFVSTQGVDRDGMTECLGHELIETFVDPSCAAVYVMADGRKTGREPGDPCQARTNAERVPIDVGNGRIVWSCNWTTRAWGVIGSRERKDYLGLLPVDQDFPVGPNGYIGITNLDGTEVQVFGPQGELRQLKPHQLHPESRLQVRMAALLEAA